MTPEELAELARFTEAIEAALVGHGQTLIAPIYLDNGFAISQVPDGDHGLEDGWHLAVAPQ